MAIVQSFGDRHPGKRRKNNEDFVTWFEPTEPGEINASGNLYILADGVGGAAEGERASQYAAQKVLHEYYQQSGVEPGECLRKLMTQASEDIFNYTEQNGRFKRMATTMVAAVVHSGKLTVAHVGDSRAYLIREGASSQLTRDHSIVGEMVASGDMTEKEALSSKIKNRLTRSLGGEIMVHVDVHSPIPLKSGDKILLCSDGLTRYAFREDIDRLTAEGSPREIVERVIQYANRCGGADNVSAILITYGEVGALEPAVRIQRPLQPISIEETLDTIPKVRSFRRRRPSLQIWAVGIFGILGTIALTVLIMEYPKIFPQTTSTSTSTSSLMPIRTTQTTETTIAPPIALESPLPQVMIEVTTTTTVDNLPVEGIPIVTIRPQLPHMCVIKATEVGKGISFYLEKYGMKFNINEPYYSCQLDEENSSCENKLRIETDQNGSPRIQIGMWLMMPAVVDPDTCLQQPTARWVNDYAGP